MTQSKQLLRGVPNKTWRRLLPLLAILLGAAFFRLYLLPTLPPGLNFDEAGNGAAAFDILNGQPHLWWRIGGGKEPLWPYLIALGILLFDNTPLTLRFPAALTGLLTVAVVYALVTRLFRNKKNRGDPQLIVLLTMLGLAFSAWHLHFSRLGFRAILLPLFSSLAFYFLWRGPIIKGALSAGRRSSQHFNFVLAALFTALAIYSYLAGRLLIFVPLLYFVFQWLSAKIILWRQVSPSSPSKEGEKGKILPFGGLGGASSYRSPTAASWLWAAVYWLLPTALFLLPLIIYFSYNPADFFARADTVSIFQPAWNNGNLFAAVWQTFRLTIGTFMGLNGDANPLVNLPNQPILPLFLAPFFILGFLLSLYQTFQPFIPSRQSPPLPHPPAPHSFLLIWWAVMLLPALLAPEGAPHHLRLIGAIVPTYIFTAAGMITATNLLKRLLSYISPYIPHASCLAYLLPILCYLSLAGQTYTNYFVRWPQATDFTLPFDLYAVRLAHEMAYVSEDTHYVIPMDIRAGPEARHYTLDYLLGDQKLSPFTYIPVDERNAELFLTEAAIDKEMLQVVRWTQDKHHEADAKEIVAYLLETNGQKIGRDSFLVYDVEHYRLTAPPPYALPLIDTPVAATFDNLLRLDTAYVPLTTPRGEWLPVALTMAPLAPMTVDYKASMRLLDSSGARVLQKDRVLRHNFHQGTSLWPPETVNEYYLLAIPAEIPAGDYTVAIVIYHPDTQSPLVADGLVEVPLGITTVK